jgi:hypothetical protein
VRFEHPHPIRKPRAEITRFLHFCAALINTPLQQLMDWELSDFLNKIHALEDDLINYQYLADMESLLLDCAHNAAA